MKYKGFSSGKQKKLRVHWIIYLLKNKINSMKTALFVGRFQPLHIGHLKVIKWILKKYDNVIIVIGSSKESKTEKNPFTLEEREKMIQNTLKKERISIKKYKIIGIPDVHDDKKWVESILEKVKFDIVFTKNSWTKRCFDQLDVHVKEHPLFGNISATKIRNMIKNNKEWENFVPEGVENILKRINLKKRLRVSVFSSL